MAILQALADLGFSNTAIVGEKDGVMTVRVRTSKGWVYERFASADQVAPWSTRYAPETDE